MKAKYYKLIFVLAVMTILIGCATIIHGGRQKIPVKSTPSGATVTINQIRVNTPGVINLSRLEQTAVLKFEKDGYEPVEVTLIRTMDGWVWGNVLIGGIIGIAIDYATGAAYQLTPNDVNVTLKTLGYEGTESISPREDRGEGTVVAVDVLSRPSSYSDYYRTIYKNISNKVVMPKGAPSGTINVGVTILSDGTLENVEILENSSEDAALREAVIKAVKECAPFPPFPDDIKEGRKAFTVMIEFKQNR